MKDSGQAYKNPYKSIWKMTKNKNKQFAEVYEWTINIWKDGHPDYTSNHEKCQWWQGDIISGNQYWLLCVCVGGDGNSCTCLVHTLLERSLTVCIFQMPVPFEPTSGYLWGRLFIVSVQGCSSRVLGGSARLFPRLPWGQVWWPWE